MKTISKNNGVIGLMMIMIMLTYASCTTEAELPAITTFPDFVKGDYSPKTGKPNELITITGTDFGDFADAVTVTFGNVETTVIESISNEEIKVRVPAFASAENASGPVSLKIWNANDTFDGEFVALQGAEISGLVPNKAEVGEVIALTGSNFGTDMDAVTVEFVSLDGFVEAQIVSLSDTEIQIVVPDDAISGSLQVMIDPQVLDGPAYVFQGNVIYAKVEAETFTDMFSVEIEATTDEGGGENVGFIAAGDWISFSNIDVSQAVEIDLRVAQNRNDGSAEIRLDSPTGDVIGTVVWANQSGWQNWTTATAEITPPPADDPIHDVYIVFIEGNTNINWWQFFKEEDAKGSN